MILLTGLLYFEADYAIFIPEENGEEMQLGRKNAVIEEGDVDSARIKRVISLDGGAPRLLTDPVACQDLKQAADSAVAVG